MTLFQIHTRADGKQSVHIHIPTKLLVVSLIVICYTGSSSNNDGIGLVTQDPFGSTYFEL